MNIGRVDNDNEVKFHVCEKYVGTIDYVYQK